MRIRATARRRPAARPDRHARMIATPAPAPDARSMADLAAEPRPVPPSVPAVHPRRCLAPAGAILALTGAILAVAATPAAARPAATATVAPAAASGPTAASSAADSAVPACTAATAQPGERPRAILRGALRCAVNAERGARGLGRLRPDRRLGRAARRHARDMVRRGYFAHERPGWTLAGRLADANWTGTRAAEAIAWGCNGRGSPLATLRAWLDSGPHRGIVLGRYKRVGIGLALGTPGDHRCGAAGTWVLDTGA
jgi:uncharacterized protein YkwD